MSFSNNFSNGNDIKPNISYKGTTLNPNAAEFVPSSFKPTSPSLQNSERPVSSGPSKETNLDKPVASVPNSSDEETHNYWQNLPDDITPDFKVMEPDLHGTTNLSLSTLSYDGMLSPVYPAKEKLSGPNLTSTVNGNYLQENTANVLASAVNPWEKPATTFGQYNVNKRDAARYNGNLSVDVANDPLSASLLSESAAVNPLKFLLVKFPWFPLDIIADVYQRSGCDLRSTVEILSHFEDKSEGQYRHTKSRPQDLTNIGELFAYNQNGLGRYSKDASEQRRGYRSPAVLSDDAISSFNGRNNALLDAQRRRNVSKSAFVPSAAASRNSQLLASLTNESSNNVLNRLQNMSGSHITPSWLELGDSMVNGYMDSKEAGDLVSLQNALLEQGMQVNLLGGDSFLKESSFKEQLYNMKVRAAQEKARETLFQQRNHHLTPELQAFSAEHQSSQIDLRGLHLSEAMHVLNFELRNRRIIAGITGRRSEVYVLVGSHCPARLPGAVEQYLFDHGFDCVQPQQGAFLVIVH